MCYLNRLTAQINKSQKDEDERNGEDAHTPILTYIENETMLLTVST